MNQIQKILMLLALLAVAALQLDPTAYGMAKQERPNWCWAACIQELEALRNVHRTQTQIATEMNGTPSDIPVPAAAVANLLSHSYGRQAWEIQRPDTKEELFQKLNQGFKIIALVDPTRSGVEGHFILIAGVGPDMTVVIGDPADGSLRPITAAELYSYTWLGSVVVR